MIRRMLTVGGVICMATAARAESSFSWHGFVSQGVTQSLDSQFITKDNDISFDLTEVGINFRYNVNAAFAVVGQGVYLNGGNRYEEGGRLDYLFLDWSMPTNWDWDINVHLGRFKSPHWLYSATRDVPQTRPTIILPQSVYFDNFRDVSLGSDGVLLRIKHPTTDYGSWEFNWSYGKAPISDYQVSALLGAFASGRVEQKYVHQVSVFWQPPSLKWQLGASWLDSEFIYLATDDEFLVDGGRDVQFYTLSAMYFAENWEFSAELLRNHRVDYGGYSTEYFTDQMGEGGYGLLRYMFNEKVSGVLGYDFFVANREDRDGEALESNTGGMIPAYYGYMKTLTLGLRWDPKPNWRVQVEHHWAHGAGRVTSVPSPRNKPETEEYWRMWALQIMYWF